MAWPNGRDTTPKPKLPTAEDRAEEIHRDLFHTENAAYGFVYAQMRGGFNTAPDRVLRWCLVYAVCEEGLACLDRNVPANHELAAYAKWRTARHNNYTPPSEDKKQFEKDQKAKMSKATTPEWPDASEVPKWSSKIPNAIDRIYDLVQEFKTTEYDSKFYDFVHWVAGEAPSDKVLEGLAFVFAVYEERREVPEMVERPAPILTAMWDQWANSDSQRLTATTVAIKALCFLTPQQLGEVLDVFLLMAVDATPTTPPEKPNPPKASGGKDFAVPPGFEFTLPARSFEAFTAGMAKAAWELPYQGIPKAMFDPAKGECRGFAGTTTYRSPNGEFIPKEELPKWAQPQDPELKFELGEIVNYCGIASNNVPIQAIITGFVKDNNGGEKVSIKMEGDGCTYLVKKKELAKPFETNRNKKAK